MEELIQEEVELFKAFILKNGEESFDFNNKLNLPILNALWRITVGERFEYDNPKLLSIVQRLTEAFKRFGKPEAVMVFAFPWINKIYPKAFGRDETLSVNHDIQDLMTKSIKQHQETLGTGSASHYIGFFALLVQAPAPAHMRCLEIVLFLWNLRPVRKKYTRQSALRHI